MASSPSTSARRLRRPLAGLLLSLSAAIGACLVSDKNLPCRTDCHCPEGQVCSDSRTCVAEGDRKLPAPGELNGPCDGDLCQQGGVCAADDCGTTRCRATCSRGQSATGGLCPSPQICVARDNPPDGGRVVVLDGGAVIQDDGVCMP